MHKAQRRRLTVLAFIVSRRPRHLVFQRAARRIIETKAVPIPYIRPFHHPIVKADRGPGCARPFSSSGPASPLDRYRNRTPCVLCPSIRSQERESDPTIADQIATSQNVGRFAFRSSPTGQSGCAASHFEQPLASVSLKYPPAKMTLSVSATENQRDDAQQQPLARHQRHNAQRGPKASLPVSPINICAGAR